MTPDTTSVTATMIMVIIIVGPSPLAVLGRDVAEILFAKVAR